MNTVRLNITVPIEMGRRLKGFKNVSAFIVEAVREKLAKREKDESVRRLETAYRNSSVENRDLIKEWDITAGDGL